MFENCIQIGLTKWESDHVLKKPKKSIRRYTNKIFKF